MAVIYDEKKRLYGIKGKVKLINGKYRNYNRKPQYKRKKEAIQAELDLRIQLENDKQSMTFDDLVKLYHSKAKLKNVKEATVKGQENTYENHIKERFGNVDIKTITSHDIELWQSDLIGKYKDSTIRTYLSVLKKYLNFAYKSELIDSNVCSRVTAYRDVDKVESENENFWEIEEFNKFISVVDNPVYNLIYTFLFFTGVRIGELQALTWNDFDSNIVTINKSKNIYQTVTSPKTRNSVRKIDLPATLVQRLKERYEVQKRIDGFSSDWSPFGLRECLSRTPIKDNLYLYIKKANVPKITVHGFRHSHASMLIKMGVDDSVIAKRLGHTVAMLRQTYAHVYEIDKRNLADKLDKLM